MRRARVSVLTKGRGVEMAVDFSGTGQLRVRGGGLPSTRAGGRLVLAVEGGNLELDVSEGAIHAQRRIIGSWVTSVPRMEDLLEHLVRWDLHPERTVTAHFPLAQAGDAYGLADSSSAGKVAIVMND